MPLPRKLEVIDDWRFSFAEGELDFLKEMLVALPYLNEFL